MIYIIIFIVIIYILIEKYLKYQDKQPLIHRQNEYAEINRKIAAGIPKDVEKIVGMDFMENSDKAAIAKIDDDYKLFFEIIDFENNFTDTIYLEEDIFIKPSSVYLYDDDQYNLPMIFHSNLDDKNLSFINNFKFLSKNCFYLKIMTDNKDDGQRYNWNIKINFEGKIVEKCIDDLNKRFDYFEERDLVFFDTNTFREINLIEFFDNMFDEYNFQFNRTIGNLYSTFLSSDNKKLGFCFFFKDEEIPRCNYSIFDINNFEKPELIFSYRIDDYGNDFKFSKDNKKIIYWRYEDDEGTIISFIIRELDENIFEQPKKILIEFAKDFYMKDYELVNDTLIIIGLEKLKLFNLETNEDFIIQRNMHSPYCITGNNLLYLNNYKLQLIDISKINQMLIKY